MKKTLKKVMASVMAIASLTMCATSISSSAASTYDDIDIQNVYITASRGGWSRLYHNVPKSYQTPVYLNISTATRGFRVQTLGVSGDYAENRTTNGSAYCVAGTEYLIYNSICYAYSYADLQFYSVSDNYSDRITGVWSSDGAAMSGHTYSYV